MHLFNHATSFESVSWDLLHYTAQVSEWAAFNPTAKLDDINYSAATTSSVCHCCWIWAAIMCVNSLRNNLAQKLHLIEKMVAAATNLILPLNPKKKVS